MSSQFSLGTPAVINQDMSQARSAQALRVLKGELQNTDTGKIDKAAKDFESILLGEWLEQAEKSFATVPGVDPDENADPGRDQFQSIGCQFLSQAMSKAGGIGIASMISKHLKATEAAREAAKSDGSEGNQGNQVKPPETSFRGLQTKE
ncbi:MAG: rod-binding protein [Terriglobales bacterium]